MDGRYLRIVTAAAISILGVLDDTGVAIKLVLEIVSDVVPCSTRLGQTHAAVYLVEQCRPKSRNNSEE